MNIPLPGASERTRPGPAAAERDGKRLSMSEMVVSMKYMPLYWGWLGVRWGRTMDQAPSAPMMRSKVSLEPSLRVRVCCW